MAKRKAPLPQPNATGLLANFQGYPQPKLVDGRYRHKYGVALRGPALPWQLELLCWSQRLPTGMGEFYHLRRAIELMLPESSWHAWREQRFQSLCDEDDAYHMGNITIRNHSWAGCAASGKTFDAAVFGFFFWLAAPDISYTVLTSTSATKIKQRAWPVIQECYIAAKTLMEEQNLIAPHMLNSSMMLQAMKGDDKHAIFAQAIRPGEVAKAVENLRGVHAPRICCIIDEATGAPEAVYRTIPNMLKGCQEFVLINSANGPMTHLDCFSKLCVPVQGWTAISAQTPRWNTKPVADYQLPGGVCHHFSGADSPNVKAAKTVFPYLYTYENWLRAEENPDIQRTVEFFSQDLGFWPPEGFLNTVLTEELIERGNARGNVEITSQTDAIAGLDPGFGGDKCVLRFGQMGRNRSGKLCVQLTESITILILVDLIEDGKKLPAEYQISRRVIEECSKRGVKPEFLGVECSGTGRGVAAVLIQEFGEIVSVESGGAPSDLQASEEDERAATEVYDRRITEIWFSVQAFVRASHLGGLNEEEVQQFCARTYTKPTRKYVLEKKEDLKLRLTRSPDDADACAVLIDVARQRGMHTRGKRADVVADYWKRLRNSQTELLDPGSMYGEQPITDEPMEEALSGPSWDPA